MKTKNLLLLSAAMLGIFFFTACKKYPIHLCGGNETIVTTTKVFATGLNNPRGLKFGPDGYLYVAEGGIGGTNSSTTCAQVLPPVGPYTGSTDGARISRIDHSGNVTTWVTNLPSSQTAATQGTLISGVADVAFVGNTLYAILSGAGCSHGVPSIPNGVIKVNHDRSWQMIANLSEFQMSHPVANPNPSDFEPDGTWYSMDNVGGNLYGIEPNHGELDKITTNGQVSRVVDISASQGHIVPTAQAYHNGNFYIGNLGLFPASGSSVYKLSSDGTLSVYASGFTMILGLAFDDLGGLYVLENTTGNPFPTPGTGDVVRIDPSGAKQVVVSGLNLPTAMAFGPDGKLYISNWGFGMPPGGGQILQVSFSCDQIKADTKSEN
ncbi:MAG TPA: ScyD/ScyE family protein [Hanamia sp.]|nr:ScyD/ScyE family protein [Hanamia sp.]